MQSININHYISIIEGTLENNSFALNSFFKFFRLEIIIIDLVHNTYFRFDNDYN